VPIREVVSQISPPIRILLILTVAVLGVYMLFLRPKPEEIPPVEPADTSVSQPGKVRDAAEDAVDAANGQLAQQESVDGVDTGEAAAGSATKKENAAKPNAPAATPAEDLKGIPAPVRKAIRKDKVLVLLFWNEKSADDRAVRASLRKVDRWNGRVFVQAAPLKQISKYGRIARGVSVEQSPTVVIADRDLRAETLVGYVDRATIDQAVIDALRNSTGLFTSSYLRELDAVCVQHSNKVAAIPSYYVGTSVPTADKRLAAVSPAYSAYLSDFKAVDAPKKYSAFRAAAIADLDTIVTAAAQLSTAVARTSAPSAVVTAHTRYNAAIRPVAKRLDRRMDAKGLFRCSSQF